MNGFQLHEQPPCMRSFRLIDAPGLSAEINDKKGKSLTSLTHRSKMQLGLTVSHLTTSVEWC